MLYSYEYLFYWKTESCIENWVHLSLVETYLAWKTVLAISQNMNQWGLQKSQFFQFFIELRKIGNTNLEKKFFFLSFSWKRKNWLVQLGENSNIKKYLCESGKNLQSLKLYSYGQHLKISNLNLLMKWEKLSSNSSFTVENKIGNLHKIRLLTFQALLLRYSITFIYKHLTMNLEKCSPSWKREFWTHCQFCACCRIFGFGKTLDIYIIYYLIFYPSKQHVKWKHLLHVYIQNLLHDEQGAKFM